MLGIPRLRALRVAAVVHASGRVHRPSHPRVTTVLAALLIVTTFQIMVPEPMLGATTRAARCDGVSLRTRATTTAAIKVRLTAGMKVVATAKVSGGRWRTRCGGTSASGSSWYRITSINGRSVKSRFGVSYVYGVTSQFRAVTTSPPALPSVPTAGSAVRVTSVPALLSALADDAISEIVVANGTYPVSPASHQQPNSLWIGAKFAGRTRPITVRAETRGGVTFDGGGATYFGGLSFLDGAHDQTWDGFNFANGQATDTGVISFGGWEGRAGPHHITLRHIKLLASCSGHNEVNDHGIYFSWAADGPHDILIEDFSVDGSGPAPLSSALHFYHSDSANRNASNVTVRRLVVTGTYQAVILWDSTLRNITLDGATITNARYTAIRYEGPGSGIVLKDIVSTGSGQSGFYSSLGANPPGVTFSNGSFR